MNRIRLFSICVCMLLFLTISVSGEEQPFPLLYTKTAKITVDGSPSDWPATLPFIIDSDSQVKRGTRTSPDASNGIINCFFDSQNLYLFANIIDSTPLMNKSVGTNIWQGDCIEGYIGFHEEKKKSYTPADFQYGITLTEGEQATYLWQKGSPIKDAVTKVVKTDKGCVLEAAIPLSNFGLKKEIAAGDPVWIDFAINNSPKGTARETQIVWWGDGEGWSDPSVWRKATITDNPKTMLAPRIISKLTAKPNTNHTIYVYSNAKPWSGEITLAGAKIKTNAKGGFPVKSETDKTFDLVAVVDSTTIRETVVIGVDRSRDIIVLPVRQIKVNQLGYLTAEKKLFVASNAGTKLDSMQFKVVDAKKGDVAFTGTAGKSYNDPATKEEVVTGDFSGLTKPGTYKVTMEGAGESYEFRIDDKVLTDLLYTTMRSYFLQRCGTKVSDPVTKLEYGPCHTKDAILKEDEKTFIDGVGGWHDAGDYGKYIPTAGITVAQLLLLYETSPDKLKSLSLDIPESKNSSPDLLDEIRWELDWMLKMQDKDGGVRHKVNSKVFPRLSIAPEDDTEEMTGEKRFVYDKGTTDTAMFCGAMAIASRVYAATDPAYSKKCAEAAIKAGDFLISLDRENKILSPMNDSTGSYMSSNMQDEQFWAFAELYRLTGEGKYLDSLNLHFRSRSVPVIGWDNPQTLGISTLVSYEKTPKELATELSNLLVTEAKRIVEKSRANGYRQALYNTEYAWASNKVVLAYGEILTLAYKITKSKEFIEAARRQLDYVLGVNVLSKSFLTAVGTDSVRYTHHRVVVSKGIIIPGLLQGGPNNNAEDGKYEKKLGPRGYVDNVDAYSCNEYAIDYNAALVYLVGYLASLDDKALLK